MKDHETDPLNDDQLDRALSSLPYPNPGAGFADRVMARVAVPKSLDARRQVAARPPTRLTLAVAASLAAVVVGSLAASAIWSLGHQALIVSLGEWLGRQTQTWAWNGIQTFASSAAGLGEALFLRKPAVSLPALAGVSAVGSLLYLSGLLTLRRLLVIPAQQVMHAER